MRERYHAYEELFRAIGRNLEVRLYAIGMRLKLKIVLHFCLLSVRMLNFSLKECDKISKGNDPMMCILAPRSWLEEADKLMPDSIQFQNKE